MRRWVIGDFKGIGDELSAILVSSIGDWKGAKPRSRGFINLQFHFWGLGLIFGVYLGKY